MMSHKATLVRLDPETQSALASLSKLLGRPMNKLVNEAVRDYLLRETSAEREVSGTLASLRKFRAQNTSRTLAGSPSPGSAAAEVSGEAPVLVAVRDFVSRVAARHSVMAAVLFGSRARGTHRADSDIDIAVVLRGRRGKLTDTSLDMADMAFDVLLETGHYIQPLPIWEDEWEHPETHSNPRLVENIKREGLRL